jgi:hypothetical protein
MDFPYVVHTAELAHQWNEQHPHHLVSINQLLERRSQECPDLIAAGMPMCSTSQNEESWRLKTFSMLRCLFELRS